MANGCSIVRLVAELTIGHLLLRVVVTSRVVGCYPTFFGANDYSTSFYRPCQIEQEC